MEKEEENRERRKGHAVKRAKRIVKRWKAFDRWRSIPSQGFPCLSATTGRAALLEENERTLRRLQWRYFTGQVAERGMPDLSLCAQVRTRICVCVCVWMERGSGVPACIRLLDGEGGIKLPFVNIERDLTTPRRLLLLHRGMD